MTDHQNWLNHITSRIDFGLHRPPRRRRDEEWDWQAFDRSRSGRLFLLRRRAKRILSGWGANVARPLDTSWLAAHGSDLWRTRSRFVDEASRLLFDEMLVLRLSSHKHHYYPRPAFSDLVRVDGKEAFSDPDLPSDYLGAPLYYFRLRLQLQNLASDAFSVIGSSDFINVLNKYQQYLIRRDGLRTIPKRGAVIMDCGACIGDVATLLGALVGPTGGVHLFDPIPLHTRFCNLQAELNPQLAGVFHVNTLATGHTSSKADGVADDLEEITPGQVSADNYSIVALDDYVEKQGIDQVDMIKMDVEGAELDTLMGAENLIRAHRPVLAISGYHKPEDLWEIPDWIAHTCTDYRLSFAHHSPVHWESVFYATTA